MSRVHAPYPFVTPPRSAGAAARCVPSTIGPNGAEWAARCRHRGQHRGVVCRAGAVGLLRPGHGVRARRTAHRAGQPAAVPQGRHVHLLMARGAEEFDVAVPRSARRHGRRGRADPGEPARLHPLRRGRTRPRYDARAADEFTAYVPSRPHWNGRSGGGRRRSPTSTSCTPASPSRASTRRGSG